LKSLSPSPSTLPPVAPIRVSQSHLTHAETPWDALRVAESQGAYQSLTWSQYMQRYAGVDTPPVNQACTCKRITGIDLRIGVR